MATGSNPEWDDERIGIPLGISRGVTAPNLPAAYEPGRFEIREGETELGRPPQVPEVVSLLSGRDRAHLAQLQEEQAARELAEAELLVNADPTGIGWLGWFSSPLAFSFMLGAAGLIGLFLFNQVFSLLATLANQPDWLRTTGYVGLALFGFCVLFAFLRFAIIYARLRRNRQLQIQGIVELTRRTRLRHLAAAKSLEAKNQLEAYLRSYPLDSDKQTKQLTRLGISTAGLAHLRTVRGELLDLERFSSSEQWFSHFRDGFQSELDAAAEKRIKYWGSRIWVVTAVAPNALVDSGATLFYTFSLLSELCQIYNLRAGKAGTAILLGRVFFNAYLAGQQTDWEKLVEDQYDQLFHEAMNVVGFVGSNLAGKIIGKVGARATTGYLNRVLIINLGRYAKKLLRPVGN